MKAGRKNLRRASGEDEVSLGEGESIMQVVALRGSNVIEVMDATGVKSLALFPAKFQRNFWIKRDISEFIGNFVVVDASGRDQALESGSKIACVVSQILFHEQVRSLEKSSEWPAIFKSTIAEDSRAETQRAASQNEQEPDSSEDDDLPPLEANTNRNRPFELYLNSGSGTDSETGS